jgi:hypothetical protein
MQIKGKIFITKYDYYGSVTYVQLTAGNHIAIRYQGGPGMLSLKVIEIENGRGRTGPPEISASSGRQNP